jgi:hypothetical protein
VHADVNGGRFSDTVGSDDRLDEEVASCSDLRLLVAGRAVGDGRDFDELDALWIERFSSGILEMRANEPPDHTVRQRGHHRRPMSAPESTDEAIAHNKYARKDSHRGPLCRHLSPGRWVVPR